MTTEKRDFDQAAATWDENPGRLKMARSVFEAISGNIRLSGDMDVMDFGCGTGLLSLNILPHVNSVTGFDSSSGMLDVLNSKISGQQIQRIKTFHLNSAGGDKLTGLYDLVTCSMTMHHIEYPAPLIKEFCGVLKSGGYLCIADLDPDEGKFHENNDGVFHNGFQRDDMKKYFRDAGFDEVSDVTAAKMEKPGIDGKNNTFSIFLITGKKL